MIMTIERIEGELKVFCRDLERLYSGNLVSVVLYGSFSKGNFIPKNSDVNLLVVLKKIEPEDLSKALKIFNKWRRIGRSTPLLLTEDYIKRSIDVFPIEFSDMKESRRILYGTDILKDIKIEPKNLRYACEKELKEKLIRLRQAYIEAMARPVILQKVMVSSFSSIMAILRNLPEKFDLSDDTTLMILRLKKKEMRLNPQEIKRLYCDWISEIEKLTLKVDKLSF